ncbi:unnamed protein product [Durusdinium trenchii]|uniref:Uncharacterized protein n=2 Tax=Durusdinium trenchii TaxID=1381693 RepID=A0ABP0MRF0_9DINO
MSKACVFHLLDTKLAQEYSGTCQEYTGYVKKPGFCHNLKQMLTCKQSDWGTAFREWGILQLYVAVVVAIVAAIIDIVNGEANVVQVTIQCCLQIIFGYIFAHLGWFAVVKKDGCFCCIVACCECPPILLFWGILMMLWACAAVASAVTALSVCTICIINVVLQGIYAIILFYMGYACLNIWIQHGKEIIPPEIDVVGPAGEQIGAAHA